MEEILIKNLVLIDYLKGIYTDFNIKAEFSTKNDEKVIAITNLARGNENKYVVFITKNGLFKKTSIEEYTKTKKKTGILAINIKENDELL